MASRKPPPQPPPREWTQATIDAGLKKLRRRLEELVGLDPGKVRYDDPKVSSVRSNIRATIREVFGEGSREVHEHGYIELVYGPMYMGGMSDQTLQSYLHDGVPRAASVLENLISRLEEKREDLAPDASAEPPPGEEETGDFDLVAFICRRFRRAALALRDRRSGRLPLLMEDEYDVQYLLGAVLDLHYDDVRREEVGPSLAGKAPRMDYLLKSEKIVVEAKFARRGHAAKEIGDELIIDVQRYRTHPDCRRIVCLVYDPEAVIANPEGFERDLSRTYDGVEVAVIVSR